MTTNQEKMNAKFEETKAEALKQLEAVRQYIEEYATKVAGGVHWGHIGDMSHIVNRLSQLTKNEIN